MKKKKICKQYEQLKRDFAKSCYDLRRDNETQQQKGNKLSFKSESAQNLADAFSSIIEDKYDSSKISRIEHTKAEVTILDLELYHKHYGVSYNYLLGKTKNKKEENKEAWEKYGLSDTTLKILKKLAEQNNGGKEIIALNSIFESGFVQPFLDYLYDYLYNDYENRLPSEYKLTHGELVDITLTVKAGNLNLGNEIVPLEKMNNLNRQILYDKLEDIKQSLKNKQKSKK